MRTLLAALVILLTLPSARADGPKTVVVFLERELSALETNDCFKEWKQQLAREGYTVEVVGVAPTDEKREFYQEQLRARPNAVGSIMLGSLDLPTVTVDDTDYDAVAPGRSQLSVTPGVQAWSAAELMNVRDPFPPRGVSPSYYEAMSLWTGIITDGSHYAGPSVRIPRFCAYFRRNLEYRRCQRSDRTRGLSFVAAEPDWRRGMFSEVHELVDQCAEMTSLRQFLEISQLSNRTYDFCQIAEHSSPGEHASSPPTTTYDIRNADPRVRFYNLYACSAAGYNWGSPNLAETYFMGNETTLGVVASTKVGSIDNPKYLYELLEYGKSFGDALLTYFKKVIKTRDSVSRNVGAVFYGDPTLDFHGCQ